MNFIQAVAAARRVPVAPVGIVTSGLIFNLDATDSASYPGSGLTWYDTAGSNNGTLANGAAYSTTGGKHIEFDGLDDLVNLGSINSSNPLSLSSINGMTLEVWVRPDGSGDSFQRVIDKSNGGSAANGWSLYYTNFQYLQFSIGGGSTPGQLNITANVWQQFIVTVDFTTSTNNKKYYRNNGATSSTYSEAGTPATTTTNARIGSWNHSTGREWNGGIGIVRIYDRILSAAEIDQNWNARRNEYGL